MVEERWHDFAKEKPSEDMEGRNFIVSNGHYEKISTWCGYWENDPFMGDRLCDEVVRWKFYFTPEEEKANEATRTEPKPMKCDELEEYYYYEDRVITPSTHMYRVYHADKVDAAIAELKKKLMPCLNGDCILTCEVVEKYGKENAELKQELSEKDKDIAYWREEYDKETQLTDALKDEIESLKASHYAESVDAGMRERRLRRALWIARAERASDKANIFYFAMTCGIMLNIDGFSNKEKGCTRMRLANWWRITWLKVERKCREKAEEYK